MIRKKSLIGWTYSGWDKETGFAPCSLDYRSRLYIAGYRVHAILKYKPKLLKTKTKVRITIEELPCKKKKYKK